MSTPKILLSKPEPKNILKPFHGKKLLVWEGLVKVSDISGWVQNKRIDLECKRFRDSHAGRDPNNDEILAIMKAVPEFRLKELADNIRINGVRQPIVLSSSGKLLDGNRRYYAVRLLLETIDVNDPSKSDFESIPSLVLDDSCDGSDEERILVQENFYPSLKVDWKDYIRAQTIYSELKTGLSAEAVGQRYGWSSAKVRETKDIMELIDEFLIFATTEKTDDIDGLGLQLIEAERIATEKYQHFNEAKKSYREKLQKDLEFKQQFFRWIYENKFSSFAEVRIAAEAWDNPKARKILLSNDIKAGKKAKALIDYERRFEDEVVEVESEIEEFAKFLGNLTTEQKLTLSHESLARLEAALLVVTKMVRQGMGAGKATGKNGSGKKTLVTKANDHGPSKRNSSKR